jgi:hypothetical protein
MGTTSTYRLLPNERLAVRLRWVCDLARASHLGGRRQSILGRILVAGVSIATSTAISSTEQI